MIFFRWCVLIVSICSVVLVNGELEPKEQCEMILEDPKFEKSPRPDLDLYQVRLSLRIGWFDSIDKWFSEQIEKGKNALEEIGHVGIEIANQVIKLIPTPQAVFQAAKDVFFGLPQEVVCHRCCNVESHADWIKPSPVPDKSKMHLEFVSDGFEVTTSLDNPESICSHPSYKKNRPTVIVITGWLSNVNKSNDALRTLHESYTKRDVNFMFFDTALYVDTFYTWSAFNTKGVGEFIGQSLVNLTKCVDPNNLHLIGHSLGAHMSGYAARTYTCMTNKTIGRITGLDPAHPCFREGEDINGLRRGDALFIDVIHTNCGVLGSRAPIGDCDFYPNGRHPLQPGCFLISCSHSRSWELYAESVEPGNEINFMATCCDSYSSLAAGNCKDNPVPMGYAVPTTTKGDYFLETNGAKPFGMRLPVGTGTVKSC